MTARHLLALLFGIFATGFLPALQTFGASAFVLAIPLVLFGTWTLLHGFACGFINLRRSMPQRSFLLGLLGPALACTLGTGGTAKLAFAARRQLARTAL